MVLQGEGAAPCDLQPGWDPAPLLPHSSSGPSPNAPRHLLLCHHGNYLVNQQ